MKIGFTKEAKIGLTTILSLALLYIGINYLKGINLFKPVNHYYVAFDNVKDLAISTPVYVDGFKVGLIRSISYDYNTTQKITVEINLDKEMKINKDSYVTLEKTLLAGGELQIHLNKYVSEYLTSGSTIEGRSGSDMMQSVQENILPGVEALIPKIDSILGGLQTLVNHPALAQSFENIEKTTANLDASTSQLNQLLNKDVPVIVDHLTTVTENLSEVSHSLKTVDFESTINSINETLANLKVTTDKLNSPDNNLGLLLNDKALYNNLNTTTESLTKLLIDFRENPKRYVHFSVF